MSLRRAGAIVNARGAAPGAPSDVWRPHGRCAPAFRVPLWVIWGAISNVQRSNFPPTGNACPGEPRACRGYPERAKPVSGRTLERPVTAWPACTVVEGAAVGDLEGIFQCAQVKFAPFGMHAQVSLRRAGAIVNARRAPLGAPSDVWRPHCRCAPAFRVPL